MIMCCNLYEVIRLREEIIMRMHECRVLGIIYANQCHQSSKPTKFGFTDQIQFNVNQLMKECVNLIDINEGSNLVFDHDLPFMEYDRTLTANLDFKAATCIKALMQDMGVAELRAILHLQVSQQQLLTVAVKMNQLLSDKAQKGLQELDLIEKKEITVPNSIVDLSSIIGNSTDSHNISAIKSERMRMRSVLTKSIADCFYMILPKKSRERANIQKRFTQLLSRLNNTELAAKPEVALRILRSYRLQQCQYYCQEMLYEAQRDSIKIQILEACNTLRFRATLLPSKCQIFRLGKSETQENLSFDSYQFLTHIEDYQVSETKIMNIHSILGGHGICSQAQTIFYIPGAEEICLCDRVASSDQGVRSTKEFSADNFNLDQADQNLRTPYTKVYTLTQPQYRVDEGKQQYGVRKVWLAESLPLANLQTYSLLVYFTQMLSIFDLEFTMLRNCSKSSQVMELEAKTQTGRPFWSKIKQAQKDMERRQHQEHTADDSLVQNKFSYNVIQKLNERKKLWVDLTDDLQRITERMCRLEQQIQKLQSERRNIYYICDLLTLQHQQSFYTFLNGLENMLEYYLDKENEECFHKLLDVRDVVTSRNTHSVILIRSNGFFASNAQLSPVEISVDENDNESFVSFKQQHQTVIDEKALMPRQISILPRIYGRIGQVQSSNQVPGYNSLIQSAFYNLDDEHRRLIGVNFTQLDELVNDYLMFKGLLENPFDNKPVLKGKDYAQEVLLAQAEILSLKIEAGHLERVVMAWESEVGKLPTSIPASKRLQRNFRDYNTLKILIERDQMNDIYWAKQKKMNPNQQSKQEKEKELIGGLQSVQQTKQAYYSKINQLRAEVKVTKNYIELAMVKSAIKMIRNEHSAILACFEISAQDNDINLFVHPSQQFASTMYLDVDRVPHLDVVAKIGCLQQFLTRLRNRCTEVETLTSGPGIVFSMKDFNDCLSIFAKQLIKQSEEELRGRCETQNIREHQYHHLIYIRQMEALYYKQKCEQFLKNIDQIVNAKMFSRGNQMIYELDLTARELQTLKDHYYIMEKCLREDIRLDYMNDLNNKGILLKKQKEDFGEFRKQLNNELSEEFAQQINDLDQLVRMRGHQGSMKYFQPEKGGGRRDPELLSEIKYLTDTIRKHKILHMFKTAVAKQKHERELADQKQKLTQNEGLWDSLAEAEKREQITAQELALTKQNLTHYERLIEKLYTQLEHLNNQKIRLEQFKKSKSKRIDELEGKMKDLEILENIDLNKILEEIRTRDNKIQRLDKVDQSFNERIQQIEMAHLHQIEEMKKVFAAERMAKNQAFEKLDAMRVEMKTLEGKDPVKNDLWKEKCKELYDICRDLEIENQNLKSTVKDLQDLTQKQQLDLQQRTTVNQSHSDMSELSYGQPNTREALILQRRQFQQKPQTADYHKPQRGLSAGRVGGYSATNRKGQQNLIQSMNNIQTLNSNNLNIEKHAQNTMRSTTLQTNDIRQALARGPLTANTGSMSANTAADGLSTTFGVPTHHPIILRQPNKQLAQQLSMPHVHSATNYQATISDTSSIENTTQAKNTEGSLRKSNQVIQMSAQGFSIKNKAKEHN